MVGCEYGAQMAVSDLCSPGPKVHYRRTSPVIARPADGRVGSAD